MNDKKGMPMRHLVSAVSGVLLACLAGFALGAEDEPTASDGASVDVEVFQAPKLRRAPLPSYPGTEQRDGKEGWVHLNMMVDPRGKPYEIAVVESTGSRVFEQNAIRAAQTWTFKPATSAGVPIDASFEVKVRFINGRPASGTNAQFIEVYKGLLQAIEAGDRTAADARLAELNVQNFYEDAIYNIGRFHYDHKWGTDAEQLRDLRRAIAWEYAPIYLDNRTFVAALEQRLTLEVKLQEYGRALQTWKILRPLVPKEERPTYQKVIDKVEAVRKGDGVVRTSAQLDELNSWNGELFKKRFQIVVASGQISDIKLRCKKQYLFFHYQPGVQYTVEPKRGGECSIQLVGDPGTKFDLIQS